MSIGEVVNLYKDNELIINPNFQRLFRWEPAQKSRLIESILLGIPVPPIFVFETEQSKWELVDGLQRLSTILEFMGLLKADDSSLLPHSVLEKTKYLPSLKDVVWDSAEGELSEDGLPVLPIGKSLQLAIRRARLGVQILKRPSDAHTKYELFQRLNSGGTNANRQEIRNCIVVMANSDFFEVLRNLSTNENFNKLIQLTDDARDAQKALEFLMRFIVYVFEDYDKKTDVEDYIDSGIVKIAEKPDTAKIQNTFETVFKLIVDSVGVDGLKRLDNGVHRGKVTYGAFEVITVGIAKNLEKVLANGKPNEFIAKKIEKYWANPDIAAFSAPGLRVTQRISRTIPFGTLWFSK